MTWGKTDNAANSVYHAVEQVGKKANTANQTALYNNTTQDAFVEGVAVGQFGVDAAEMGVSNGSVVSISVITGGYGYFSAPTVTIVGDATGTAVLGSAGEVASVTVTSGGSSYASSPLVSIAPPEYSFDANAAVSATGGFITVASNVFEDGQSVTYSVDAGNTAIVGLVDGNSYYVVGSNTSGISLAATVGGDAIELTKGIDEVGHNLVGETATAGATVSGAAGKGFHSGWVLRTEGTGGRAGRVQYETLVATGTITGDGEDVIFKDS